MDNNDTAEDERRGVKRKMSLSRCDVCGTEEAKYRCPNCMKHTCSLSCVKQHKMCSGCSGFRDKTAFISLSQFDEMNLLSDYRFLEDTDRLRQSSNRDAVMHGSHRHPREGIWLIRKARAANVTLKILPKLFSRHRENRTIFRKADGLLHWHLKIHFPQSEAVYSERFPDNREVHQILRDFIHPSESDPVRRQKLKVYVHSPPEDIKIFMKSEQTQPNSLRYLELEPQKTLRENLMHKTVVEYPEIFVVLKQHTQEYVTRTKEHFSAASENVSRKSEEPVSTSSSHVQKKAKIISEADELEDGEIRSDDDESDGDEDDVTEKTAPESHRDAGRRDEEKTQACLDGHMGSSPSINSRAEERLIVSQTLGDVGGQTETMSSLSIDVRNKENNADIYASDGHLCADGTREETHDGLDTENAGFASQHLIPRDIRSETDSHADISDNMGGENANIYSCEGHVPAVVHSKDANADSVDVHSPNVYTSDSYFATDVQGSNQADVCKGAENANVYATNSCIAADIQVNGDSQVNKEIVNVYNSGSYFATDVHGSSQADVCDGAENANVYASNSCTPEDIHVEGSSQANAENANSCAIDSCIATDMQLEATCQMNAENANVYASDRCTPTGIHVEGSGQANLKNANVYTSNSCIPADIQVNGDSQEIINVYNSDSYFATDVHGSSQADVCDGAENANVYASNSCTPEDIHVEGSSQANAENANSCASDSCIAKDMQVEGASQMNLEDANVYASDSSTPTDIHVEGSGQANLKNVNVSASNCCFPADVHVEGVNVENAQVYASEGHVLSDIPSESSHQVNIGDSVSDVSSHVSYQTVCTTEHRV